MNELAEKYFADLGFEITKLVAKRPHGTTPQQVKDAAGLVYLSIVDSGFQIPTMMLARRVYQVAKEVGVKDGLDEAKLLKNYKKVLADYEAKLEKAEKDRLALADRTVLYKKRIVRYDDQFRQLHEQIRKKERNVTVSTVIVSIMAILAWATAIVVAFNYIGV